MQWPWAYESERHTLLCRTTIANHTTILMRWIGLSMATDRKQIATYLTADEYRRLKTYHIKKTLLALKAGAPEPSLSQTIHRLIFEGIDREIRAAEGIETTKTNESSE